MLVEQIRLIIANQKIETENQQNKPKPRRQSMNFKFYYLPKRCGMFGGSVFFRLPFYILFGFFFFEEALSSTDILEFEYFNIHEHFWRQSFF